MRSLPDSVWTTNCSTSPRCETPAIVPAVALTDEPGVGARRRRASGARRRARAPPGRLSARGGHEDRAVGRTIPFSVASPSQKLFWPMNPATNAEDGDS